MGEGRQYRNGGRLSRALPKKGTRENEIAKMELLNKNKNGAGINAGAAAIHGSA
jgi:hypothetical protein